MAFLRARLAPLLVAVLLAGCGGGGRSVAATPAARLAGDYTGSYATASDARGASEGAIVLDVDPTGAAEGSVTVRGVVYDFKGRVGGDGTLDARGEGIVVAGRLDRAGADGARTLAGDFTLSGEVDVPGARATLTRVAAP